MVLLESDGCIESSTPCSGGSSGCPPAPFGYSSVCGESGFCQWCPDEQQRAILFEWMNKSPDNMVVGTKMLSDSAETIKKALKNGWKPVRVA